MNQYVNSLLLLLFLLVGPSVFAQEATIQATTDEQLAAYYYRQGEFDKALLYYERLYDERPSDDHYQYYLNCLLALEEFKEAEKLAEKQAKLAPQNLGYQVDIGRVYKRAGDESKADKHFDKLIKDLNEASINQIVDLGKAFSELNDADRALEVFYKGRKMMGDSYPFHFQIAQVLGQKGDIEGMINEYLDVLLVSKGYLQSVQNTLNRVIGFDEQNQYNAVLEEALMERVQKRPDDDIYAQMLVWMLVRQDRYDAALVQVKALDKRNREDGGRVMSLARTALENFQYDVAADGFSYVAEKGPGNYYYSEAVTGKLRALKEQVVHTSFTTEELQALINAYRDALDEFGKRASTWEVIRDLAHIQAFYAGKYDPNASKEAAELLEASLNIGGLNEQQQAALKMELANIHVLNGRIWEASLLYGQVEKRFKYDEIGFQAKLNNAKVFYYSGDFGWAEAQLDVLKGSTSKLIANDAMELATFISENTGLDTTTEALATFAHSELLLAQHKYDSAIYLLDLIERNFPGHELADNILFQRASIDMERGNYESAAEKFLLVAETYPSDILADNALMEAGRLYEQSLNNREKAMGIYEQVLTDFPGSLFVVEARKRYRILRGDQIN